MNNGGDAAEQIVRLSLEGVEVAAKLTGSAAKNVGLLLAAALKKEISGTQKTRGKSRLTSMLKSGKELKVFAIPQQDLQTFTEHAKQYGILYCVLKDQSNNDPNAVVDIIARAEDASKIQRIADRYDFSHVDKASIITEAEKDLAGRGDAEIETPEVTKGEQIVAEALGEPNPKEDSVEANPLAAKTDKSPLSEHNLGLTSADAHTDKGNAEPTEKRASVKERLERCKVEAAKQKEAERTVPESDKAKSVKTEPNRQTVHKQPKKQNKSKER